MSSPIRVTLITEEGNGAWRLLVPHQRPTKSNHPSSFETLINGNQIALLTCSIFEVLVIQLSCRRR